MRTVVMAGALSLVASAGLMSQNKGKAGKFDFYLMSLSWSPQHCAEKPGDNVQCGGMKKFGFVLHGLWPQYEKGYPQSCATTEKLDQAVAKSMLDIMPSDQLILHEWQKHGVCNGTSSKQYFAKAREAFGAFKTPAKFQQPTQQVMVKPAAFKKELLEANPALHDNELAILCNGRYFQEARVCLNRNLEARACSKQVKDRCTVPEMIVRPVR